MLVVVVEVTVITLILSPQNEQCLRWNFIWRHRTTRRECFKFLQLKRNQQKRTLDSTKDTIFSKENDQMSLRLRKDADIQRERKEGEQCSLLVVQRAMLGWRVLHRGPFIHQWRRCLQKMRDDSHQIEICQGRGKSNEDVHQERQNNNLINAYLLTRAHAVYVVRSNFNFYTH